MIEFNKPYLTGKEIKYIEEVHKGGQFAGEGKFTQKCNLWLEQSTGCYKGLLTHSCTAALEMAAILLNIKAGDEIIMPSYTFVSAPNAFVLRGAVPVFVDVRPDTLNIDETLIESAITSRTKAIVPMHYAGIGCEMDVIMNIASRHNLVVIEDAAQGVLAKYKDRALGTIGDLGCFSFHETKNIISGEGGALLINNPELAERAEVILEKGTNRNLFFRGQVDKYSWVDIGSSYQPGEITAAFLWAQIQEAESITERRMAIWNDYHTALKSLEMGERLRRPIIPQGCTINGHLYYLLMQNLKDRNQFIKKMKDNGINCVFHYVPLHSSLAGKKYGRISNTMMVTEDISDRLVRLPVWIGVDGGSVIESIIASY